MRFFTCFGYLALVGILSNLFASFLPRRWFRSDSFFFRPRAWERGGKAYDALQIRRWKDKVPDMSRILPGATQKRITGDMDAAAVERLSSETCVSEFAHDVLIVFGLRCLSLWEGAGGVIITLIWVLIGNLPCIMIQRYNRPRLDALARTMRLHAAKNAMPLESGTR